MPRKPSTEPAPNQAAEKQRRYRKRKAAGLVPVQIGGDSYEVSEDGAKRLRSAAEALQWALKR